MSTSVPIFNAAVGSNVVNGNLLVTGSERVKGNLEVDGTLQAAAIAGGVFNPTSVTTGALHVTGNGQVDGSLTVNGTLTAGTFAPSSISTGLITCTGLVDSGAASAHGLTSIGDVTATGNAVISGTVAFGASTLTSGGGAAITGPASSGTLALTSQIPGAGSALSVASLSVSGTTSLTGTTTAGAITSSGFVQTTGAAYLSGAVPGSLPGSNVGVVIGATGGTPVMQANFGGVSTALQVQTTSLNVIGPVTSTGLTTTGSIQAGTNAIVGGAVSATSITNSGTMSALGTTVTSLAATGQSTFTGVVTTFPAGPGIVMGAYQSLPAIFAGNSSAIAPMKLLNTGLTTARANGTIVTTLDDGAGNMVVGGTVTSGAITSSGLVQTTGGLRVSGIGTGSSAIAVNSAAGTESSVSYQLAGSTQSITGYNTTLGSFIYDLQHAQPILYQDAGPPTSGYLRTKNNILDNGSGAATFGAMTVSTASGTDILQVTTASTTGGTLMDVLAPSIAVSGTVSRRQGGFSGAFNGSQLVETYTYTTNTPNTGTVLWGFNGGVGSRFSMTSAGGATGFSVNGGGTAVESLTNTGTSSLTGAVTCGSTLSATGVTATSITNSGTSSLTGAVTCGSTLTIGGGSGTQFTSGGNVGITGPASIPGGPGILGIRPFFFAGSVAGTGGPLTITQTTGTSAYGITTSATLLSIGSLSSTANVVFVIHYNFTGTVPTLTEGAVSLGVTGMTINGPALGAIGQYNAAATTQTINACGVVTMVTTGAATPQLSISNTGFTGGSGGFYIHQAGP